MAAIGEYGKTAMRGTAGYIVIERDLAAKGRKPPVKPKNQPRGGMGAEGAPVMPVLHNN